MNNSSININMHILCAYVKKGKLIHVEMLYLKSH